MTPDSLDLGGKPRVIGGKPDLGCYEYVPSGFVLMVK